MEKLKLKLPIKLDIVLKSSLLFSCSDRFIKYGNFLENAPLVLHNSAKHLNDLVIKDLIDFRNLVFHINIIVKVIKKLHKIFEIDYKLLYDNSCFNINDIRYKVDDTFFELIYYSSIGFYNNEQYDFKKHIDTDVINDVAGPFLENNRVTINKIVTNENEVFTRVTFSIAELIEFLNKRFDLLTIILFKAKLILKLHVKDLADVVIAYNECPIKTLDGLIEHSAKKFEDYTVFDYFQQIKGLVSYKLDSTEYNYFKSYINDLAKEFIKYYQKDDKRYLESNFYLFLNNLTETGYEKYNINLSQMLNTLLWEVEYYDKTFYDFSDENNSKVKNAFNDLENLNKLLIDKINENDRFDQIRINIYLLLFKNFLDKEG